MTISIREGCKYGATDEGRGGRGPNTHECEEMGNVKYDLRRMEEGIQDISTTLHCNLAIMAIFFLLTFALLHVVNYSVSTALCGVNALLSNITLAQKQMMGAGW